MNVTFCDELSFCLLLPTSSRVYVWRLSKGSFNADKLFLTFKHENGSLMTWGNEYLKFASGIVSIQEKINSQDYLKILGNKVHPMVKEIFPDRKW